MANPVNRQSSAIEALFEKRLEDLHTAIPARVDSVDYSTGYITAQPLVKARYSLNKYNEYPPIGDIPPLFPNDGYEAFITMPLKVGATVLILFSERDPSAALESDGSNTVVGDFSKVMGLYPIGWTTLATLPRAKEFSSTDIVINNGSVKINCTPRTVNITNGSGTFTLNGDGTFTINGLTITTDGNIITAAGVNLNEHIHGGVQPGMGTSTKPL